MIIPKGRTLTRLAEPVEEIRDGRQPHLSRVLEAVENREGHEGARCAVAQQKLQARRTSYADRRPFYRHRDIGTAVDNFLRLLFAITYFGDNNIDTTAVHHEKSTNWQINK